MTKIASSLSGADKDFFDREFSFFNDLTGISGKLKALLHETKDKKKRKIGEELMKIKLQTGVYIPTNPESVVVDIDYTSGRPLQSAAKCPFMATFKVEKSRFAAQSDHADDSDQVAPGEPPKQLRQASIFKVGDDCRQDMLALQVIAVIKTVCEHSLVDGYLYPYRIVATAPSVRFYTKFDVAEQS